MCIRDRINTQLGNLSYVVVAIVGGLVAINGIGGFTLGSLASFLTLNKSFQQPINQISNQLNSIVMALAGGDRIFRLLDEKPEVDDGYVTLTDAVVNADGTITAVSYTHLDVYKRQVFTHNSLKLSALNVSCHVVSLFQTASIPSGTIASR